MLGRLTRCHPSPFPPLRQVIVAGHRRRKTRERKKGVWWNGADPLEKRDGESECVPFLLLFSSLHPSVCRWLSASLLSAKMEKRRKEGGGGRNSSSGSTKGENGRTVCFGTTKEEWKEGGGMSHRHWRKERYSLALSISLRAEEEPKGGGGGGMGREREGRVASFFSPTFSCLQ